MNDIHDLLGAYCTDALDPQERTAFEEHLAACSECRDEAADFREVLGALADAHPVDPPGSLADAVVERARTLGHPDGAHLPATSLITPPAPTARPTDTPLVPARRRLAPWMAAAAAGAVLFASGFSLGRQPGPSASASGNGGDMAAVVTVAAAADARVLPVDFMGTASRVVMSQEMDKAVFLASELPTPAGEMVYQMWSVTADGQMVSAGVFTPADDGHLAALLQGGAAGVEKWMITLEPPGGSEHPTGEMLAEINT
ncbi:MAG: anti-sigma factor [Candidatus Nanopelagicales bacterium]